MALGSKILIVLAWLLVPIAASLFMRNSYAAYITSCNVQRQNCELRAWHVDQYSRELNKFAPSAGAIRTADQYNRWLIDFDQIRRRRESSSAKLDLGQPEYYQVTDTELIKCEAALGDMFRTVADTALVQLDYVRSAERLNRLAEMQRQLEASAYYYKQVGMEGIYMQFQEELGRVEDEIRSRKRQRSEYLQEVAEQLDTVNSAYLVIQRSLDHIGDKLTEDEDQTYRSQLKDRVMQFNLGRELSQLVNPQADGS